MQKLRYYAAGDEKKSEVMLPQAFHSEFLRTGRISRDGKHWVVEQRRYLTYEEVAEITGRKLEAAGTTTHKRINSFHRSIQFPKLIFHKTLAERPHLGYCHVTAAKTNFAKYSDVRWAFYIANFFAEIGNGEQFFEQIRPQYSRMYFAIAMQPNKADKKLTIDRTIRANGLLFRTQDPKEAFRNILMLGAKTPELRGSIEKIFEANAVTATAQ